MIVTELPEKAMATHSTTLAWRIQWAEKPGGLQYMGSQRARHDLEIKPPPPMPVITLRESDWY